MALGASTSQFHYLTACFWGTFLGKTQVKSRNEYLTYCSCQIIDITQLIDIQLNKSTIFSRTMADGRWQFIWGQGTRMKKMVKNS